MVRYDMLTSHVVDKAYLNQSRKAELVAIYPDLWARMTRSWRQTSEKDKVWQLYSANYLLRTRNVRWAIDPVTLQNRVPEAPDVDIARDLAPLDFVLLTHSHADHLDLRLIRALRSLPVLWVIPEVLVEVVSREAGLSSQQMMIPSPGCPIHLKNIHIIPFDGLHCHGDTGPDEAHLGVPAMGYWVEQDSKRWLFPGDTRRYNVNQLPDFGPVDVVFAHIWLGRGCALMDPPPLLDVFCQFFIDLQPERILLTHLEEFGREPQDFWDAAHIDWVVNVFNKKIPNKKVIPLRIGECIPL